VREAAHSRSPSSEVKNEWIYTYIPSFWLYGVYTDSFIFTGQTSTLNSFSRALMVIEVGCPLGLAWWGVGGGPCLTLGTRQWFYGLHKRRGICYHQSDCQCRVALGIGIEVCFNRTNCCSRPEQPVLAEWLRQVDGGWNHQVQFKSENNPSQPHFKVTQGRTENYTRCIHTKLGTDSWLLHLKYSSALTPSDQIWNGKSCDQYPHKINFKSYYLSGAWGSVVVKALRY
jgi:hypothetical protein